MLDPERLRAIRDGRHVPRGTASIVIPHFETPELVRLCLRAIRRLTDHPYECIVVDNHSRDGSAESLREVGWIRLIERGEETEADAVRAHASAMDRGIEASRGRWIVSFHTDTIVRRAGWLGEFVTRLEADPKAACLGSGKIETDPAWYRAMKRMWNTRRMKAWARRLVGAPPIPEPGWYPRSYCALYDAEKVRELGLDFQAAPGHPAGERMYRGLLDAGYTCLRLNPDEMHRYVEHVSHATALLARGGLSHWRGNRKVRAALARVMGTPLAQELMEDDGLDL